MSTKEVRPTRRKSGASAPVVTTKPGKAKRLNSMASDIHNTALKQLAESRLTEQSVGRLRTMRCTLAVTKDRKVSARVSGDLLATVKLRLGVSSDAEAIEMALVNMAETDDFGVWMEANVGRLDKDFDLGEL